VFISFIHMIPDKQKIKIGMDRGQKYK